MSGYGQHPRTNVLTNESVMALIRARNVLAGALSEQGGEFDLRTPAAVARGCLDIVVSQLEGYDPVEEDSSENPCPYCGEFVSEMPPDGIAYCVPCERIVEGAVA